MRLKLIPGSVPDACLPWDHLLLMIRPRECKRRKDNLRACGSRTLTPRSTTA